MSATTTATATTHIELQALEDIGPASQHGTNSINNEEQEIAAAAATNEEATTPDTRYGWIVVASSAVFTFWFNGISTSWGVMQTALLNQRSYSSSSSSSTLSFVGTLSNTIIVASGLLAVRFMRLFGARTTGLVGILLYSLGEISSSFVTDDVGALFGTTGALLGTGASLLYMSANVVPNQYFGGSGKRGLANGIVKAAGGVGGTVLSVGLNALINKVGIPWTFRITGLMVFVTGIPAAWFLKEHSPVNQAPKFQLSMFKNLAFDLIFLAGAIGTFALFIPVFFLPLFASSIGLSSSTGAALVAGFNACTTIGRLGSGLLCDRIGSINTFLLSMLLNAVSMLAIWPLATTMPPLLVFAMLNGCANGAFFTTFPTVVAGMFDPEMSAVAMSLATTGWSGGYLLGAPIAGYLLQAEAGGKGIQPYRLAIFYAGGVAMAASGFVLIARLKISGRKILKKV